MSRYNIRVGDSRDVLRELAPCSVDACVTDPPYELGFMGKGWDKSGVANDATMWRLVFDALKPGAHLVAFSGTRTYHRMACAIEDAGFEIRDQLAWTYGSGFPKSRNVGGGWGTALKPAWEPICFARKPLEGTVVTNVLAHGTGAINVDGCRVETSDTLGGGAYAKNPTERGQMWGEDAGNSWRRGGAGEFVQPTGRFPANLLHDGSDEVLALFPDSKGQQGDVRGSEPSRTGDKGTNCYGEYGRVPAAKRGDSGSAARFFYCAKASKADRTEGNDHPTVKPTELMRWLCRLVTPTGGLILDPFTGSGSTGRGALLEGFRFFGIEQAESYAAIAERRIQAVAAQVGLDLL